MLQVALEEARAGMAEGGIPIGSALFDAADGRLLGRGHNRRVQPGDPVGSRRGRRVPQRRAARSYRDTVMVTTLAPCWYCSGLIRQFGIPVVVVGESRTFQGGIDWLREHGVADRRLRLDECADLLQASSPRARGLERGHRRVAAAAGGGAEVRAAAGELRRRGDAPGGPRVLGRRAARRRASRPSEETGAAE